MKAILFSLALWVIVHALTIAMVAGAPTTAAKVREACSPIPEEAGDPNDPALVTIGMVCIDNETLVIQQTYYKSRFQAFPSTYFTYVCTDINGTEIGTGSRTFYNDRGNPEMFDTGLLLSPGVFCEIVQGCYQENDLDFLIYPYNQVNCTVPSPVAPTSSTPVIRHTSLTEAPTPTPTLSPTPPTTDVNVTIATTPSTGPPENGPAVPITVALVAAALVVAGTFVVSLLLCCINRRMRRNKYTCHYLEHGVEFETGMNLQFAPVDIEPHLLMPAESLTSIFHALDVKDIELEIKEAKVSIHKSASINLIESDNYPSAIESDKATITVLSGRSSPESQNLAEAVDDLETSQCTVTNEEAIGTSKAESPEKLMSRETISGGFPLEDVMTRTICTSDGNETREVVEKHVPCTGSSNSTKTSGYIGEQQLSVPQMGSSGYKSDSFSSTLAHDEATAVPCVKVSSGGGYVGALEQDGTHQCQSRETDFQAFCDEEFSEEIDTREEAEKVTADPHQHSSTVTHTISHSPLRQTSSGYVEEVDTTDQPYRTEEATFPTMVSDVQPQPLTVSSTQQNAQTPDFSVVSGYVPHPDTELLSIDKEVGLPLLPIIEEIHSLQVQQDACSMQDQFTGSGYLQDPFSSSQTASLPSGEVDLLPTPEANKPQIISTGSPSSGYVQEPPSSYQQDMFPGQPLPYTPNNHFSESPNDLTPTEHLSPNQIPSLDDHIPTVTLVTSKYGKLPLQHSNTPTINRQGAYLQNNSWSSIEGEKRDSLSERVPEIPNCPPQTLSPPQIPRPPQNPCPPQIPFPSQTLSPPECRPSLSNDSGYQPAPTYNSRCSSYVTSREPSTSERETGICNKTEGDLCSIWESAEVFSLSSSPESLDDGLPQLEEDDCQWQEPHLPLAKTVTDTSEQQTPPDCVTAYITDDVAPHTAAEHRLIHHLPQAGRGNDNSGSSGYVTIPQAIPSQDTNQTSAPKNTSSGSYASANLSKHGHPKHLMLARVDSGYSMGDSSTASPSTSSSSYSGYLSSIAPTPKTRTISLTSNDSGCSAASASDSLNMQAPPHLCATSNGYYKC